jgi:hypothetical protein
VTRTARLSTDDIVASAESHLGYTARPNRVNSFGERIGINGQPWDGIFVDHVLRETGVPEPFPHLYPPVALARYISTDTFYTRPRRGDIAFLQTSTVSDFGSPHVGIVTDVSRWDIDGTYSTVEGMTDNGLPKASGAPDGVYRRVRHRLETVGFGRPKLTARHKERPELTDDLPRVVLAQVRHGVKHPNVTVVQLALAKLTGVRGLPQGHFDGRTRVAMASFQRSLGWLPSRATGVADVASMRELSERSGFFIFDA